MPESKKIQVSKINDTADLEKAYAIRTKVFVDEQGCPPHLEHENEELSNHFLATIDDIPVAACRWRLTDKGIKLERFAVLKQYRGLGIGQELIKAVLADLPADVNYVYLHAQTPAVPLYLKFDFETVGDEFEEAGIWHYKMVRR